jgi:hypothetical protein
VVRRLLGGSVPAALEAEFVHPQARQLPSPPS